jgi:hypothetical protein
MAAWLLQKSIVGEVGSKKSLKVSWQSQMASLATCIAAIYLASAVKRVISSYLHEY